MDLNTLVTLGIEPKSSNLDFPFTTKKELSYGNDLTNVFDSSYFQELLILAGAQLGKMADMLKDLPSDMKGYMDDNFRDKAMNILLSAGSVTAGFFLVRKLHRLYENKQLKAKEMKETCQIDEAIKEQQKEAESERLRSPCSGQDKRELCILCVSNRRECVFLDCGHICVCVDCLKSLPFPKTCPICRCKIIQTVLLFHA